jgi:toxin-antitoxin system PIN domain toxin
VILVDANLLLYAKIRDLPQHGLAHSWLDERLNAPARVGLPWPSLLAFYRIATNPRVLGRPLSSEQAWRQIEEWLALDNVWIPLPSSAHASILAQIVKEARPVADLVPDAHLAALAIEHGLTLCSTDGDFARFAGLRWENPLQSR